MPNPNPATKMEWCAEHEQAPPCTDCSRRARDRKQANHPLVICTIPLRLIAVIAISPILAFLSAIGAIAFPTKISEIVDMWNTKFQWIRRGGR